MTALKYIKRGRTAISITASGVQRADFEEDVDETDLNSGNMSALGRHGDRHHTRV